MAAAMEFLLRGEHIALDALLKASGLVASGGEAKVQVMQGAVAVNGQVELRRGRKVRAGDVVSFAGTQVQVRGA